MKAALYVRVSTDEQAREGFSIPAQIKALQEYCKKNKVSVYNVYADEGISGTKENRPAFQQMINAAKTGLFEIIIVHKFDRFARKVEMSQRIKNSLKKANVNVISATEPIEDSPIGFFQEGILELLAEYYVRNLSQEVKKGQREKASQGYAMNMLCYGYKNIGGEAHIVQEEADTVKAIYNMYNQDKSTSYIAKWLNEHGIPTKFHGKWYHSQVRYILRNKTYTGCLKWGKKEYENTIPAIIKKSTFNKTQSKITTIPNLKRKAYYDKFLLLGVASCGYCGSAYRVSKMYSNGNRENKFYFFYTCSRARRDKALCGFSKHFQSGNLEKSIIKRLRNIMNGNSDNFIISDTIDNVLYNRKAGVLKELERAKNAYLQEVFTVEEYSETKNKLESELVIINNEIENSLSLESRKKKAIKNASTLYEKFKNTKAIDVKKGILLRFVKEIKIYKDSIMIVFRQGHS